jgi:hypothetical protein
MCNTSFNITVDTIFHNTKIPLCKWFMAITLLSDNNFELSVRKIAQKIHVTKDTASRMRNLIFFNMRENLHLFNEIAKFVKKGSINYE